MSEMSDKLNNISVQLGKAHDDIVAKIDELTRALESAQAEDPDVAQALTNLQTAADSIAAIVPPVEAPAETGAQ